MKANVCQKVKKRPKRIWLIVTSIDILVNGVMNLLRKRRTRSAGIMNRSLSMFTGNWITALKKIINYDRKSYDPDWAKVMILQKTKKSKTNQGD